MKKVLYIFFLLSLSFLFSNSFANTAPYGYFSKGSNISPEGNLAKYINVRSEKIEFEFLPNSLSGSVNKIPYILKQLVEKGYSKQYLKNLEDKGVFGLIGYGRYGPEFIDEYLSGSLDEKIPQQFNLKVKVEYNFINSSNKEISIDSAFSPLATTKFYYGPYYDVEGVYSDRNFDKNKSIIRIYDNTTMPYNLVMKNNNKQLDYQTKYKISTEYFSGAGNPKINFIKPVYKFNLNFKPKEEKKVTFEYYTNSNDFYGEKGYGANGITYDFKPIFEWGDGTIGSVDISIKEGSNYSIPIDSPQYDDNNAVSIDELNKHLSNNGSGFIFNYSYTNVKYSQVWDKIDFENQFLFNSSSEERVPFFEMFQVMKDGGIYNNYVPEEKCEAIDKNKFMNIISNQPNTLYNDGLRNGSLSENNLMIYDQINKKLVAFALKCEITKK